MNLFQRKYLISFSYLAISVVGLITFFRISIEYTPEIQLPSATISYTWGTTSPEIMEEEITRVVEGLVGQLRDVEKIRSVSQQGRSAVTIDFTADAPIDFRLLELREQLSRQEERWPDGVSTARISRKIPKDLEDTENFIIYTLSGTIPPNELLTLAENRIRNPLMGKQGIVDIELSGVSSPALIIDFDLELMQRLNLSSQRILSQVQAVLQNSSAGFIQKGTTRYNLQLPVRHPTLASVKNMPIRIPNNDRVLRLEEIAKLSITNTPPTFIRRINGNPSLSISFIKEKGSDAFALAKWITSRMQEIENDVLPESVFLRLQLDATDQLRAQFASLQTQALWSVLIVFCIVWLFIRQLRAPFIILGSILFSVLMSVSTLYFLGYSLNILTLAGITVAVGMLIDNAVVVFEQINKTGLSSRQARIKHIKQHLGDAWVPVIASTLTTVGIFVPLLFALDELRIFLVPLAIAITLTLCSSVLIAFTWIPYAYIWLWPLPSASHTTEIIKKRRVRLPFGSLPKLNFIKKWSWLRFLHYRNRFRFLPILLLVIALGLPTFLLDETHFVRKTELQQNFFGQAQVKEGSLPKLAEWYFSKQRDIDPWLGGIPYRFNQKVSFGNSWGFPYREQIYARVTGPQGTPLEEFDKIVKNFEKAAKVYEEAFSYYEVSISEFNGASMQFIIKDEALSTPAPYRFLGEAMYLGARTGNVWSVVSGFGVSINTAGGSSSISERIVLRGYDYDQLTDFANYLKGKLEENSRVRDVDINGVNYNKSDYQEYKLRLRNEDLAALNMDRGAFLQAIALDMNPRNAMGRIFIEGQEMSLIGRNTVDRKVYAEEMLSRKRNTIDTTLFSIDGIGSILKENALSSIKREDQEYERVISFEYRGRGNAAREFKEQLLETVVKPDGIRYSNLSYYFNFRNKASVGNLGVVSILSLLCVWMIITALLESWREAIRVLIVLPLSLLAIMVGAMYSEITFERGAVAGSLLCVGVVVNNAILLVHQRQLVQSRGIEGLRSWAYAFSQKTRSILITTLTTVGGLVPLVLMEGEEFWTNLATVVAWGLGGSTLLIFVYLGLTTKGFGLTQRRRGLMNNE